MISNEFKSLSLSLNQLKRFISLNQLRSYHLIQNKNQAKSNRKLLSIKSNKLENVNRQMSNRKIMELTFVVCAVHLILFVFCKKIGPDQTWYFDKMFYFKIKLFNLISKDKMEIVNAEDLNENDRKKSNRPEIKK